MTNPYYTDSADPATASTGRSAPIRAQFAAIEDGFDKLPTLSGNANKVILVNAAGTSLTASATVPDGTLAVTQSVGDSSTKIATTAFVAATAFSSALPAQTGNSGNILTTNGSAASWGSLISIPDYWI
jgi:hypothetical protein